MADATRKLLWMLPCSILLGVAIALFSAYLSRRLDLARSRRPHFELSFLLLFALGAFINSLSDSLIPWRMNSGQLVSLRALFCARYVRHR